MSMLLDDVARIIASPISRRKAFRLVGGAVGGAVLASLGLGRSSQGWAAQASLALPVCPRGSSLCTAGKNSVCCGNILQKCCTDKGPYCCGVGQTCCQGTCCPAGTSCCNGRCCANVLQRCCKDSGSYCCGAGQTCCQGKCCNQNRICCGGKCCTPGPSASTPCTKAHCS